jgi:thioredoxin-like negative regulator of GroEL
MTVRTRVDGRGAGAVRAALPPSRVEDVAAKPVLVFVYSSTSGRSRRVEGFLAQVLQGRRNHGTFTLRRVEYETRPDLANRLGVERLPAIVVVEAKRVRARLEEPRGCADIKELLARWLK